MATIEQLQTILPAREIDNSGRYVYSWMDGPPDTCIGAIYKATAFPEAFATGPCEVRALFHDQVRPYIKGWNQPTWQPFARHNGQFSIVPKVLAIRPKCWVLRCATDLEGAIYYKQNGITPEYIFENNKFCYMVDTAKGGAI